MAEPAHSRRVLFVCTGNQCRSPAAERIFLELARRAGLVVEAGSAGTAEIEGAPAYSLTARAARDVLGVSLDRHRSRGVSAVPLDDYDLILGMAAEHADDVRAFRPDLAERVHTFRPYCEGRTDDAPGARDIADPICGGPEAHRACVRQIAELVAALLARWAGRAGEPRR